MRFAAGEIVLVDWRDGLPKEPNKQRPAVVVEDEDLVDAAYPNVIVVPLAENPHLAIEDLSVAISPTPENGCSKSCFALAHYVTTTSKYRITRTPSRITDSQLAEIRELIAVAIGLDRSVPRGGGGRARDISMTG